MMETMNDSNQKPPAVNDLQFGEEIEVEAAGFSFSPIKGFELEINGGVYMYSDDGNLEISLSGGALSDAASIAELNDRLAAEFMEDVDDYKITESGTDTIQGVTGFLNEIIYYNAEEQGIGRAFICSPYLNQYFFILVISSADYRHGQGQALFTAIKNQIHFHQQFKPETIEKEIKAHPDLTIETYTAIPLDDELILSIEKGDVSLLLAARSQMPNETIAISAITAPGEKQLYHYDPVSGAFSSSICTQPLTSEDGEVCLFYPRSSQQALVPGEYRFSFTTETGSKVQEVQVIIRSGRALDLQWVDLNFWIATDHVWIYDSNNLDQFEVNIKESIRQKLAPFNLAPGKIECFYPAPDELESFKEVNLDEDLADCSYMIAESVNTTRALNIGLVDRLTTGNPPIDAEVRAVSTGSPGMLLSASSPHACIVVRWSAGSDTIDALADAIIQQLIIFSGIELEGIGQPEHQPQVMNREVAWRMRRHPLFYDAD